MGPYAWRGRKLVKLELKRRSAYWLNELVRRKTMLVWN